GAKSGLVGGVTVLGMKAGQPSGGLRPNLAGRTGGSWSRHGLPALRPLGEEQGCLGNMLFHRALADSQTLGDFAVFQVIEAMHQENFAGPRGQPGKTFPDPL